jgi:hypothetical protein
MKAIQLQLQVQLLWRDAVDKEQQIATALDGMALRIHWRQSDAFRGWPQQIKNNQRQFNRLTHFLIDTLTCTIAIVSAEKDQIEN